MPMTRVPEIENRYQKTGSIMPMTRVPEIENRYQKTGTAVTFDMQFGTKFVWYRFSVTNRTCSIVMPLYGSSFWCGFSAPISGTCVIVWHHPTYNKSLEWNPYSAWDYGVRQRSSYQRLGGRQWVTERFLSLPPGRGTVCREQSLLPQPCIHSVEPWKLIYSLHVSDHLSYIICILS